MADCACGGCCGCGSESVLVGLKFNTFTSLTVMMLSLISGIIGFVGEVPISITILSVGLILTAFTILGLMIYPRISRNE